MGICLLLLILLPLVGAGVGAFVPARSARMWALFVSLATLGAGVALVPGFNFSSELQFPGIESKYIYGFSELGFTFLLGVDSISLWMVLLTVLLMPPALLASFESIKDRPREYYAWMLVLLAAMNGVFLARDLLLFYICFELTLVPMFFIIGIWGGPDRRYAAAKFFLFTFAGGVFMLATVIYMGVRAGTFEIADVLRLVQTNFSATERFWVTIGLLAGFAVKIPLFPVHTWLPLAHTEAPTAGSVILAGVLLKLGTYGLLRLVVPVGLVANNAAWTPSLIHFLGFMCLIGILYGALVAWVQQDIKKLVAYSSVSHLGFCVLGLVALNDEGMQGSVLYMINHGLSTGAMFLVIGMVYDRLHTRDIDQLSGLGKKMPRLAFFFVFFVLSSIGLPGLNGFVSEFLTVLGAFKSPQLGIAFGVIAAIGVILGALYMLHMTARVIFGPLKYPGSGNADAHGHHGHDAGHGELTDIGGREVGLLIPIALAVVLLGVLPRSVLTTIAPSINSIRNPIVAPTADRTPPEIDTQIAEPRGV